MAKPGKEEEGQGRPTAMRGMLRCLKGRRSCLMNVRLRGSSFEGSVRGNSTNDGECKHQSSAEDLAR